MEIKIDKSTYIYKKDKLGKPHRLTAPYKTRIAVNKESSLNYVDLFFGTYHDTCTGTLRIMFSTPGYHINYKVEIGTIQDNLTTRFIFDSPFVCNTFLEISIDATITSDNVVAIWTNENNICAKVNIREIETVVLSETPLISILTPVYKTDLNLLKLMVDSVRDQYYQNWELCIVDDNSNDVEITKYLKSLKKDKRIKVRTRSKNGGIAVALNDALNIATGLLVCNLDHDDLLESSSLMEVVRYYCKDPEVELLYSDEDKIDMKGELYDVFHKPDWSYYQLLSQNYLNHLTVYRTKLVKELGGIQEGFDGAQDYNFILKYIEKCKKIVHIPKVLYHWRSSPNSTANGQHNKPFSRINAVRAISNHLQRVGVDAKVTSEVYSGVYRVDRSISGLPSVNIIIPFKDKLEYLKACLYSIKQSTYKNFFVTLVDNLSEEDKTIEFLNSIPEEYFPEWADSKESYLKTIVYSKPFNFSAINNYAVENSEPTDILLFLNNDTEVITTNWLEQMVQHAQNKEVGAVGAKLLYPNGSMQHAGVIIGIGGVAGHSHKHVFNRDPGYFCRPHLIQELSAVTGACLMVRTEVFKEVGGFEEDLPKAFNDVDLCLKIRGIGYKIIYTPYSILYHYESISRGLDNAMEADFQGAITYMLRKWNCLNFKDPYYNVNLSKTDEKFSVL